MKNYLTIVFLFVWGVVALMPCVALGQGTPKKDYMPKSATTEMEHLVSCHFGQHQIMPYAFKTVWGGRGLSAVTALPVSNFEITYAKWFHERNYIGASFRTGRVNYQLQIANDPLWPIYDPAVSGNIAEVSYNAWHLYYLGFFWKYDFLDEVPLIKGKKRDLLFQTSILLEGGVNLMSEGFSEQGTYVGQNPNGDLVTWGHYDQRTIRTTQIRYGLRSRSTFTFDRYALLFDVGLNQGFRDFHFFQIESNPVSNTQPYFDLRNSLSYIFWNVGLGYWF